MSKSTLTPSRPRASKPSRRKAHVTAWWKHHAEVTEQTGAGHLRRPGGAS